MDQTGSRLSAATPLAENQHGYVGLRQRCRLGTQLAHDWADPDEEGVVVDRLHILAGEIRLDNFTCTAKVAPDDVCQLAVVEGPYEVVPCPQAKYFLFLANIAGVINQDNRQCRTKSAQPAQDVQTIRITLRQIQQEQIRRYPSLNTLDCLPDVGDDFKLPVIRFPHQPEFATKLESRLTNSSLAVWITFPSGGRFMRDKALQNSGR